MIRFLLRTPGLAILAVLGFVAGGAESAQAQDWPQWRGPSRDGVVPAASAPTSWPGSFTQAWRVEIGEGYSSPVVSGQRVFVHSRQEPEEVVLAIDITDGKTLWRQQYPAAFEKNQYARRMSKGPNATPLVIGDRLYTFGTTAILTAWDKAAGERRWSRDFSKMVDTSKMFCGTAASPLEASGHLIIQAGSDVHGGQILALDLATGATKWEWRGAGPGYASPIVINLDGTAQVVTLSERSVVGLNAATGAELWSAPFPDEWHENIVTPVWTGSHLIVSGTRQGTHAYALQRANGRWRANQAWNNTGVAMYMSSPVCGDGLIYGHSAKNRGQFVALDAQTGATRWASDGREGEHASVLLTPRHIVYLTQSGDLTVVRRHSEKFEAERRYKVSSVETLAMPVLLGSDLLVRNATALVRLTPAQKTVE